MATPKPTDAELATEIILAVFRVNGRLLQKGDELVAHLALTSARWQMLGALALAGEPLTAPQIGEAMGVTRQGAQKQLNLLLDERLVETRANPRNQRSPLYVLTPAGARVYEKASKLNEVWTRRLAKGLQRSQLVTALDTLVELHRRLEAPVPGPREAE